MKDIPLKRLVISLGWLGLLTMPVRLAAQGEDLRLPRYTVKNLGLLGPAGAPLIIRNNGLIVGTALVRGGTDHAVFWHNRMEPVDLGTPGLGGQNSVGNGVNDRGQFAGAAQTAAPDTEDFCGFQAAGLTSVRNTCLPFVWNDGVMLPLPTLGGNNGIASAIDNRREVAGFAETNIPDPHPHCPVHQFKPVVWQNGRNQPQPLKLPASAGDLNGEPFGMNDNGQIVGASGDCTAFNPVLNYFQPLHALLWQTDGTVIDLGNLGGTGQAPALGNWAISINNHGQVVGSSDRGDGHNHAFLWTRQTGKMQDLGTVPGDSNSGAIGINDAGVVVGVSSDDSGNLRAFIRLNGTLIDLNRLILAASPFHLLLANSINSRGEIIGVAIDSRDNQPHGFLAIPSDGEAGEESAAATPDNLSRPENARDLLPRQLLFGRAGAWLSPPR